jgi:hypothetical protein
MDQVKARSGLGRTVVSQAFSSAASPPSGATVSAIAEALGLDVSHLLKLLEAATESRGKPSRSAVNHVDAAPTGANELGRPIADWDPHDLEIHPAADAPTTSGSGSGRRWSATLPTYVSRAHDEELAVLISQVDMGHSRMAVLVGTSSTGKTRACWEAIQPLSTKGWRLWHPFDPSRAEAALADIERVGPHTVVWLNEAQHYFGASGGLGERVASAIHSLLADPKRGPILVLGTIWPEHADTYTALPENGRTDVHSHTRALLSGRLIALPDSFDAIATKHAQAFARTGDSQLAHALQHAHDGRVTQFLAGVPELLRRYESASPSVRALLDVAMDARRLGVGIQLPVTFLEQAVEDYLNADEYDRLADNWLEHALTDTARPVHGNIAPLRRNRRRSRDAATPSAQTHQTSHTYRLADYLEQHGGNERKLLCPPASFWQAAHDHLSPPDLIKLAEAARHRYRNRWTCLLLQRAAEAGHIPAVTELAWFLNEIDSDLSLRFYEHAIAAGDTDAMILLAQWRDMDDLDIEGAEELYWQAAAAGSDEALEVLSQRLDVFGIVEGIVRFYKKAVEAGETQHLDALAEWQQEVEELEKIDWSSPKARNYAWNVDNALILLGRWLTQTGVRDGADLRKSAVSAADASTPIAYGFAEFAIREATEAGHTELAGWLTELRDLNGNYEGAEQTILHVVDAGGAVSLQNLLYDDAGERWPNFIDLWPNGLEPDGSPSGPWSASRLNVMLAKVRHPSIGVSEFSTLQPRISSP